MTVPLIRLNKGDFIEIDGVRWDERERTTQSLVLQKFDSSELRTLTGEELRDLYFDPTRRVRIVRWEVQPLDPKFRERIERPYDTFDAGQQREMLVRLDYVKACERFFAKKLFSKTIDGYDRIAQIVARYRRLATAHNDGVKPSRLPLESYGGSTVRDWYMRWVRGVRQIGSLAPLNDKKGNRTKRLDPAVERLIDYGVKQKWLTLEAPPVTVVHDFICREVEKLNEKTAQNHAKPSEMAVRRWIRNHVDNFTAVFHRKGRKEAEHQFRLTKQAPVAIRPLQIVEYDDTPLDIILVKDNGEVEGRAYLTAGTCLATGMVVGWHIGTEKPSWTNLMQALRMSVLKKDPSIAGCESPYPVYGVPEMVKADNGAPYRSRSLVAAAGQLQFELRLVPVGKPHLKGKVERFFLEVARDFTSVLPGRTFSNIQQRGDYDPAECAAFTLEEVQILFMRWVVDIYHNRPNSRAFGQTPLERWQALSGCGVRMPPEKSDLTALLGMIVNRTIQAEGIQFMGLTYTAPILKNLKMREVHLGQEWMVKIDPLDMSELLVLNEADHRWESVQCNQMKLVIGRRNTPLTLRQWIATVKRARIETKFRQRVTEGTLLRAREFILAIAEEKGNVPKGEITERDREWLRQEVNKKQEYNIEILATEEGEQTGEAPAEPAEEATAEPTQKPQRAAKTNRPDTTAATAPASEAGGIPLPEREVRDDAGKVRADAERQAMEEEQEAKLKRLHEESRAAKKAVRTRTAPANGAGSSPAQGDGAANGDLPFHEGAPSITPDGESAGAPDTTKSRSAKRPAEGSTNARRKPVDPADARHWGRAKTQTQGETK